MKSLVDVSASPPPVSALNTRWPAARRERTALPATLAPPTTVERRDILLARGGAILAFDSVLALIGAALGYGARYVLRVGGLHQTIAPIHPLTLALLGCVVISLTVLELARAGAYRRSLGASGLTAFLSVPRAVTVASAVVIVASAALQEQNVSRLVYAYIWIAMVTLLWAGRWAQAALRRRAYRLGCGVRRVVVVGMTPVGKMVMQNMATRRHHGYAMVGYIAEHDGLPQRFGRFTCLGTIAEIDRVVAEQHVDEFIIALPSASHARIADLVARCEHTGVAVKLIPDLLDLRLSRVRMDAVAGIPLIDIRDEVAGGLRTALKRVLDLSVAACALVVVLPIMGVTALAIRLESPGPIFFRQERLGKQGQPFMILKFRSMRVDAERQLALLRAQNEAAGPIFKMRSDPRVTRVGRLIRKLSIDELPQLWNVLRGEMSLVGPRPPLRHEVDQYEEWHRRRLETTPGITCLWGVSGRSKLDFDEMVMLDLYYMDNWSLGLDLRILVRTAFTLLRPSGAY